MSTTTVKPTLETWTIDTPDSLVVYHRRATDDGDRGLPTAGRCYPKASRKSQSLTDDELALLIKIHGPGRQRKRSAAR